MNERWFFLSYARTDSIGPYVKKFYTDLAQQIRKRVPLHADTPIVDIGFIDDRGVEVGDNWLDSLGEALQSTKVLVCLYSRGYFASQYCGKEFEVFRRRTQQNPVSPLPLIMPVLWDPSEKLPSPLPSAISHLEYTNADFGRAYSDNGLYHTMCLKKHRDDYMAFLFKFAEKLVDHARRYSAPRLEMLPSLSEVSSAFHMPATPLSMSAVPPRWKGPDAVHFYFLAGRKIELQSVRKEVAAYGDRGGPDWRPFAPDLNESIGLISQRAAVGEGLISHTFGVEASLIGRLSEAEKENTIVFLIVDPWTVRIASYRDLLKEYDGRRFVNSGAILVWNERDRETRDNLERLQDIVKQTMARHAASKDPCYRDSIQSARALQKEITATILELRRRLMRTARILRPLAGTGGAKPPSISGSVTIS